MERFFTTIQLGAAICILTFFGCTARSIAAGTSDFLTFCFAAMTASTWHFLVKPAWAEFKEARAEKKGGQQ